MKFNKQYITAIILICIATIACTYIIWIILGMGNTAKNQIKTIEGQYQEQIEQLTKENNNLQKVIDSLAIQDTVYLTKIQYIKINKSKQDSVILSQSCEENLKTLRNKLIDL